MRAAGWWTLSGGRRQTLSLTEKVTEEPLSWARLAGHSQRDWGEGRHMLGAKRGTSTARPAEKEA